MKVPTTTGGLSAVTITSTVFTCGRAAWLRGGVPGAIGHIRSGGSDLGAASSRMGKAHALKSSRFSRVSPCRRCSPFRVWATGRRFHARRLRFQDRRAGRLLRPTLRRRR